MMKARTILAGGRAWTLATGVTAAMLCAGSASADDGRTQDTSAETSPPPAPAPPPPLVVEIQRPVPLELKKVPRVITDWEDGEPIPAGYHPVQRARKGAIIGGAVPLAVLYFLSALGAAISQDSSQGHDKSQMGLYFPVVGPFVTMAQTSSAVGNVFLAMDGLGQAFGAALVIYGLSSPQTVLMRDDHYGSVRVAPRPMLLGRDGGGMGLFGTF